MTSNDDLRSVRIEVEGAIAPVDADAPELDVVVPAATPKWVAALALLVVAAVGAALVVLQPDRDETADDQAPSEPAIVEDVNDGSDDQTEIVSADEDGADEVRVIERGALTPVNLNLEWSADSIVASDEGFLALQGDVSAGATPPMFRSVDGREWVRSDTSVVLPDGSEVLPDGDGRLFDWSALSRTDVGFAIVARPLNGFTTSVFTSEDGSTWQEVQGFGSVNDSSTRPVFVDGDSVIGMSDVGNFTLNGVIATHTDLGGGSPVNICDTITESDSLLLVGCSGEVLPLGEENVVSDRPAIEVLQCVQRLARVGFGAPPVSGSLLTRETGEERPFLPVAAAYDLSNARPSSAPLALLDFGVIDLEVQTEPSDAVVPDDVCDGIAPLPELGDPAVVVIEPDLWTNGFRRLPFPDDGISTNPANVSVVGVLESDPVTFTFAPRQHVVVQRPGGAVWLADVQTEDWTFIGGENQFGREIVAIDDAGERVYQINAEGLTAFDFEFRDDLSFEVEETRAELDGVFRGLDDVLFASKDVLFFTDESDLKTDLWVVDTSSFGGEVSGPDIEPFRIAPAAETSQIVLSDLGLIGLVQSTTGPLELVLSVNGVDWVPAETTVTSLGEPVVADYFWFGLREAETGFALWGSLADSGRAENQQVDLFTSDDGFNWEQVDGFGSLNGDPSITIPAAVDDQRIVGREFTGDPELTQILLDHTDVEIPESGMCGVVRDGLSIRPFSCSGEEVPITLGNITSDVEPAQVLSCIGSLAFSNSFSATSLTITDRFTGRLQRLDETLTGSDFKGVALSNGLLVLRDEGVFEAVAEEENPSVAQICAGIGEPRSTRAPAAVVFDPETLEVTRFDFPAEQQPIGRAVSSELLGAVTSPAGDREVVLFAISDALWLLDIESGEWSRIAPADQTASEDGQTAFALSRSGPRVYRVASTVTVFDLTFAEPGEIGTEVTTLTVQQDEGPGTSFDAGSILFADTERVFYLDFSLSGAVWSLPIPTVPSTPPVEPLE